jgi:hypothetical protein
MRRFIAVATLLLLSLSRIDATTQVHARATASVAKATREMIAAAPSVRLADVTLRESPRGTARVLVPWHPSRTEAGLTLPAATATCLVALPEPASPPIEAAHRLTYDATAPPLLL